VSQPNKSAQLLLSAARAAAETGRIATAAAALTQLCEHSRTAPGQSAPLLQSSLPILSPSPSSLSSSLHFMILFCSHESGKVTVEYRAHLLLARLAILFDPELSSLHYQFCLDWFLADTAALLTDSDAELRPQ
jgi:hypothetical protein